MKVSDRIFGLVTLLVAAAYIVAALNLRTSFMTDPLGSKTFPILIGAVAALCGLLMVLRPDPDPEWPRGRTLAALGVSLLALIGYSYALKPLGFLVPTAVAAAVIAWLIEPRPVAAALAGVGLSAGLFVLFRYVLGLGLVAFPT